MHFFCERKMQFDLQCDSTGSQRGEYDLHILCAKQIEKRKCAHLHCDQRLRKMRFAFEVNRSEKKRIFSQSRVMPRALENVVQLFGEIYCLNIYHSYILPFENGHCQRPMNGS